MNETAATTVARPKRRWLWSLAGIGTFALTVQALLWAAVPLVVVKLAPDATEAAIGRRLQIGAATFNPFSLQLELESVRLPGASGQPDTATLGRLSVDLSVSSVWKQAPVIERLALDGLQVALARNEAGELSIDDILSRLAETPPSPEPARYALHNVRIRDAALQWSDAVSGQSLALSDIQLQLPFLSTLPADVRVEVAPKLEARIDGGSMTLQARATPFDGQPDARLDIAVTDLPLALAQPWLRKAGGVELRNGLASADLSFVFAEPKAGERRLSVSGQASLQAVDARVMPRAGQALDVHLPRASLTVADLVLLSPPAEAAGPGSVELTADAGPLGQLAVKGSLGLTPLQWAVDAKLAGLDLLQVAPFVPESVPVRVKSGTAGLAAALQCAPPGPGSGTAPDCRIPEATLTVAALAFAESSGVAGPAPVLWNVPTLTARATDVRLQARSPVTVAVEMALAGTAGSAGSAGSAGQLKLDARLSPEPLAVDAQVRVYAFRLPLLQPYLQSALRAELGQGTLDVDARLALHEGQTRAYGRVVLGDVRLAEQGRTADPLLRLEQLRVEGLEAQLDASGLKRLAFNGVRVAGLDARIERDAAGGLNWLKLLPAVANPAGLTRSTTGVPGKADGQLAQAVDGTAGAKSAAQPLIEVGDVQVERTNLFFSDAAVQPPFSARLTGLKGRLSAFSTEGPKRSTLELAGSLDGDGLLVVSGQVNPVNPRDYLNISLRARGIEMTRLSPYSAKYAGYNIAKGRLSTTLNYRIENGALVAENSLFLDQLNFGDAVDSPDATTLPVRLAVALLKNLKGEIDLNLPVSGSLNDPQFSIGDVVFKALGNIILKAVSAPFRLVASLFDSGEEFAGQLDFEAGSSAVPASADKQIRSLASLLAEKPDLEMDVTGYADPLTDTIAIRRKAAVEKAVRDKAALEKSLAGSPAAKQTPSDRAAIERAVAEQAAVSEAAIEKAAADTSIDPELIRRLAYERAVAARNAIIALKPEVSERVFLVAPSREQLGRQAEKPRMAVDFSLR